jgi:hypothetical protein
MSFHLHLADDLGHAVNDVVAAQEGLAVADWLGRGFAVASAIRDGRADASDGLGHVQLPATRLAAFGQRGRREEQQLVLF